MTASRTTILIKFFSILLLIFAALFPLQAFAGSCECEQTPDLHTPAKINCINDVNESQCNGFKGTIAGPEETRCDKVKYFEEEGCGVAEEIIEVGTYEGAIEPNLQIPDFNVQLSDIVVSDEPGGRYITVSWLAEYIAAIYQYLVGAATILAIVMIMYGGFRWITAAGDAGKIGEAKATIVGAVVGLVLALGSYTILSLVNPDLVSFQSLRLALVERDEFDEILVVTKVNTTDPETSALPPGPPPSFDSCPVSLEEPYLAPEQKPNSNTEPRTEEFKAKISPIVAGKSTRQRIVDIAQAAALCGMTMGSCGKTVLTINSLAGVSGRGKKTHSISNEQMQYLKTINCSSGSPKSCYTNAKTAAYTKFANEIPGWPDAWANELQAGDAITVFNANSSQFGTHAAIFMGWEGNWAQVIQGSYGKDVKTGKICIKSGCGNPTPLVRTFKP